MKRPGIRAAALAVVPVLALSVVGFGALGAAHADEPRTETATEAAGKAMQKATDAFGKAGTQQRGRVRAAAAPSVLGDWNSDGRPDLLARDAAGKLWFYRGTGNANAPYRTRVQVGRGFHIYNLLVRHGDWDGDGRQDLLAREPNGKLWFYKGTGAANGAGFGSRRLVGGGWQIHRHIFGVDDWNGDGKDDLGAVDNTGKLWMFTGRRPSPGAPAFFSGRLQVGRGFQIYNSITALGKGNEDGGSELFARDARGNTWMYDTTGNPTWPLGSRYEAGDGANVFTAFVGAGDVSAGGVVDLLLRHSNGVLVLLPFEEEEDVIAIGGGWNIYNSIV